MAVELSVIVKDTERSCKQKFLLYNPFSMDPSDSTIDRCIKETMEMYGEFSDDCDVIVKANMIMN